MTQEDKELLLKDLSARLTCRVMIYLHTSSEFTGSTIVLNSSIYGFIEDVLNNSPYEIKEIKPYLRPISSMTEEEEKEYHNLCYKKEREGFEFGKWAARTHYYDTIDSIDYLNSIHIDYRGLIEKGLAIKVTKENNPYEK